MAEEPILWVQTGYQPPQFPTGEYDEETGEPIVERLPVTARPPDDHPLKGQVVKRWDRWVDKEGNVVAPPYTGGAADYDVNGAHGGQRLVKRWRRNGWFLYGECPVALVQSGVLPARYIDKELRGVRPCAEGTYSEGRPCLHARAEAARRKAVNARVQAARSAKFKDETKSILEAAKEQQAEAGAQQTQIMGQLVDLVRQQAEMLRMAVGGGLMKKPDMVPTAPDDAETGNAVVELAAGDLPQPEPALAGDRDDELARMMDEADAELGDEPAVEREGVAPRVPFTERIEEGAPATTPPGRGGGRRRS